VKSNNSRNDQKNWSFHEMIDLFDHSAEWSILLNITWNDWEERTFFRNLIKLFSRIPWNDYSFSCSMFGVEYRLLSDSRRDSSFFNIHANIRNTAFLARILFFTVREWWDCVLSSEVHSCHFVMLHRRGLVYTDTLATTDS